MKIFFPLLLAMTLGASAAEPMYPATAIPEALKINANAVKRTEVMVVEISQLNNVSLRYKYAITVLNEAGDKYAVFSEWYDKFRQVVSIEGALYSGSGELLKKAKAKDFADVSAVDDISLIDDNRLKHHKFYYNSYPYTVEYEVVIRSKQTFSLPSWIPQDQLHLSVEASKFAVVAPADYQLRYKAYNYDKAPATSTEKGQKKYEWSVTGLKALKQQFAAPRWHERTTMVSFAPSEFEVDGYKGTMNSWKSFGQFINALNKGRDQLPETVKQDVSRIVSAEANEFGKVRALYEYLQKNTRYISIQLGIGGWQPFDAAFVAKNGYGDCKALTNYMQSLLKAAGIPSHYALIKAGSGSTFLAEDFPSTQFNHAVLCVPMAKDTVWLECTSQTQAAGYMGDFTGNRKALIITDDGAQLVSTPAYTARENVQKRVISGRLDANGNLSMKLAGVYEGTQQEYLSGMINNLSKDKIQKLLQEELELSTYEVNSFGYTEAKMVLPNVQEDLDLTVSNYATVSGKRMFIVPNILSRSSYNLVEDAERTSEFVFENEYTEVDSITIEVPDGYELESAPAEVKIDSPFGSYYSKISVQAGSVLLERNFELRQGRFPVSEQKNLIKHFQDIYKADRSKVVFVKKQR